MRRVAFLMFFTLLLLGLSGSAEAEDASFTGIWNIVPLLVGAQQASPGFAAVLTQTGTTVTGKIEPDVQINGTASGHSLAATVTRGDSKTSLTLTLDPTGMVVTGTIVFNDKATVAWVGTRKPETPE